MRTNLNVVSQSDLRHIFISLISTHELELMIPANQTHKLTSINLFQIKASIHYQRFDTESMFSFYIIFKIPLKEKFSFEEQNQPKKI